MRLYGGPADGRIVDGAVYSSRWLSIPVLETPYTYNEYGTPAFGAAVYERSGDVYLYIERKP